MDLLELGYNSFFHEHFLPHLRAGLVAGRVAAVNRGGCDVLTASHGSVAAEVRTSHLPRARMSDW